MTNILKVTASPSSSSTVPMKTLEEVVKMLPENPMQALINQVQLLREKRQQEIEKEEKRVQFLREEQARQKASQLTSRLDDTAWLEQQAEKKKQAEAEAKAKLAAQTVNQGLQQGSVGLVQESQPMVKAEESMANSHQRDQSRDKMRNVILSKYTSENSKKAQGGDDALLSSKVKVESSQQGGAASSSSSTTVANTEHTMATKIGKRTFDDDDVEVPKPKVENKDLISEEEWNSSLQQSRKYYTLPNFNMENQNTVQLTVRVPPKSQAWSLNLSPTEDFFGTDILFHYNPRYNKRQIVLNDRQGTWGDFTLRDMDNRPTRDCVIRIYITDHGFYLYTDSRFEIFFRHRRDITEYLGQDLKLWFTYRDDNGNPHSIILKKVLWQHTDMNLFLSGRSEKVLSIVNDLMSAPLSESVANPMKPRTILMRGLPILSDLKILQGIEYSFFQSMKEFEPSSIALVPETQYAFIRLSRASSVKQVIAEFDNLEIGGENEEAYSIKLTPMVPPVENNVSTTPAFDDGFQPHHPQEDDHRPQKKSRYDVDEEEFNTTPITLPPPPPLSNTIEMEDDGAHTPDLPPPPVLPFQVPETTTPDDPPLSAMDVSSTPREENEVTPEKVTEEAKNADGEEEDDDYDDLY